jgi:hypothetical protein
MLSITAFSKDSKTIELNIVLNEEKNTWDIKTTIDYSEYFITNFVFHHQINTLKSVTKMFKLCKDDITYSVQNFQDLQDNDIITISILVDYIDDEIITFDLLKKEQNNEEILKKRVSALEEKIILLEKELHNKYISKSVEGTFYVKIVEEKFEYKAICSNPERQEEFEQKMLEAFKSTNINMLIYFSLQDNYISESSIDKIKKTIKKVIKSKNVYEIWEIISEIKITPKNQLTWYKKYNYYNGNNFSSEPFNVDNIQLNLNIPMNTSFGYYCMNNKQINSGDYSYYTSIGYVKYDNYFGSIHNSQNVAIKSIDQVFMFNHIKFSFIKLEKEEDIINLDDTTLTNVTKIYKQSDKYNIFEKEIHEKEKTFFYLYDV